MFANLNPEQTSAVAQLLHDRAGIRCTIESGRDSTWEAAGSARVLTVQDPAGETTTYVIDVFGRITYPVGTVVRHQGTPGAVGTIIDTSQYGMLVRYPDGQTHLAGFTSLQPVAAGELAANEVTA